MNIRKHQKSRTVHPSLGIVSSNSKICTSAKHDPYTATNSMADDSAFPIECMYSLFTLTEQEHNQTLQLNQAIQIKLNALETKKSRDQVWNTLQNLLGQKARCRMNKKKLNIWSSRSICSIQQLIPKFNLWIVEELRRTNNTWQQIHLHEIQLLPNLLL